MTPLPLQQTNSDGSQHLCLVSDADGVRLDRWLTEKQPHLSRARIQMLVKQGHVRIAGRTCKPSTKLHRGDPVVVVIPPPTKSKLEPEPIPLNVLHEDADILVINKPPNLVVHPAPGHAGGTLVNALLHHCSDLDGVGGEQRPGIVHRLDRDTSGVLVVAKKQNALDGLAAQFKARKVRKVYWALAWGRFKTRCGRIETLIGRDPHNRKKMSARVTRGRIAITHYKVLREMAGVSLVEVVIETGRTHQIRVHLAHIGHPVVGDRQYGRAHASKRSITAPRQMLHARSLSFEHPVTGLPMQFTAPLPADMQRVLDGLAAPPA